jgi:hypothetical protein
MQWTPIAPQTRAFIGGRRSRVVLTPRRWCQIGGAIRRRRWQTSPVTGESTKETVKTIERGKPGVSGEPVVTTLVCFIQFAYEAAGASRARLSLRPLISGVKDSCKPRTHRAARMRCRIYPRRPGQAKRDPGPITTDVSITRSWSGTDLTTNAGGYGSLRSQGRRRLFEILNPKWRGAAVAAANSA